MKPTCLTSRQKAKALGLSIALLAAYSIIIIAAGHGFGPVGLLLALGALAWPVPVSLGWAGVVLTLISILFSASDRHARMGLYGIVCLVFSLIFFLAESEAIWFSIATAVPFLALAAVRLRQIQSQAKITAG